MIHKYHEDYNLKCVEHPENIENKDELHSYLSCKFIIINFLKIYFREYLILLWIFHDIHKYVI